MKLEKKKKEGKGKGKEEEQEEQEEQEEEEAQGRGKEGGTRKLCSVSSFTSFNQFPSSSATEHSTYKCGTGVLRW